jgi:hypothetical protein
MIYILNIEFLPNFGSSSSFFHLLIISCYSSFKSTKAKKKKVHFSVLLNLFFIYLRFRHCLHFLQRQHTAINIASKITPPRTATIIIQTRKATEKNKRNDLNKFLIRNQKRKFFFLLTYDNIRSSLVEIHILRQTFFSLID